MILLILLTFISPLYSIDLSSRITLNLKKADIHNILTSIAREQKYNIVIPPYVSGEVTIFLNNVTIEDAFKIITELAGFAYYVSNDIIFIDKKESIDKKFGSTDMKTEIFDINFSKVSVLVNQIKEVVSEKGKIFVDERTNKLIVTDIIPNLKKVKEVIAKLDIPTGQVMIEAKIVIIKDSAAKEFGIQWGGSLAKKISSDNFYYGLTGAGSTTTTSGTGSTTSGTSGGGIGDMFTGSTTSVGVSPTGSIASSAITAVSDYAVNIPTISSPVGGLGLIFGKWGYYNLAVKLTALKSKNLAKEISSPKVLALDNEKASIGEGVEIPYKTVSEGGTETQFKDAKLKLEVTPHISSNSMIALDIGLNKDSPGQMTDAGPTINSQEITTKLLVKDGETAVIGGILGNTASKGESKVPFFGDLPMLGAFFKNDINSESTGELLIFITPKIVKTY